LSTPIPLFPYTQFGNIFDLELIKFGTVKYLGDGIIFGSQPRPQPKRQEPRDPAVLWDPEYTHNIEIIQQSTNYAWQPV